MTTMTEGVPVEQTPRRRSDAGTVRVMPRDSEALVFLADQRAVEADDLGVLLARLGGRGALSPTAVDAVLRRWRRMGLVEVRRLAVGDWRARVVLMTPEGQAVVGYRSETPTWTVMRHTCTVARVRLWLAARHPDGAWTSERQIRADLGRLTAAERLGVPDGVLDLGGTRHAIEVELSDKGPTRTAAKLTRLLADYPRVIVFTTAATRPVMEAVLAGGPRRGQLIPAPPLRGGENVRVASVPTTADLQASL